METHPTRPPDAPSTDAADFATPAASDSAHPEEPPSEDASRRTDLPEPPARIGEIEGHLPDRVEPLTPLHPETALTETRRLRHDGWTPQKKRRFLERFAECGIIVEACEAVRISARSAYNLRDRDPLFAAGWEAAQVMARPKLADEAYSRSMNGVVDRIYKDGIIVAERHRYDNRLTMAVLARLDSRIDRAEEKGAPHLALVARWDDYLAALEEDRREDGLALLAAAGTEVQAQAGDRELRELHPGEEEADVAEIDEDPHLLWEERGRWWTDYPPPAGFEGEEEGECGDPDYRRTLSPAEKAVVDSGEEEEKAAARAEAEALRDAHFGFSEPPLPEEAGSAEPPADSGPSPASDG